jgi:hypothetical protein
VKFLVKFGVEKWNQQLKGITERGPSLFDAKIHNPVGAKTADFKIDNIDDYIPQGSRRLVSILSEIKAGHFTQLTPENLRQVQREGCVDH